METGTLSTVFVVNSGRCHLDIQNCSSCSRGFQKTFPEVCARGGRSATCRVPALFLLFEEQPRAVADGAQEDGAQERERPRCWRGPKAARPLCGTAWGPRAGISDLGSFP